jgi:hypothetical protein
MIEPDATLHKHTAFWPTLTPAVTGSVMRSSTPRALDNRAPTRAVRGVCPGLPEGLSQRQSVICAPAHVSNQRCAERDVVLAHRTASVCLRWSLGGRRVVRRCREGVDTARPPASTAVQVSALARPESIIGLRRGQPAATDKSTTLARARAHQVPHLPSVTTVSSGFGGPEKYPGLVLSLLQKILGTRITKASPEKRILERT